MNGDEFLKSETMYSIVAWHFPVWYFLVSFWINRRVFPLLGLLRALLILLFYCLCFWLPYFSPESFGLFCIWLLICFRVISSQLLIEFSFVVLECPVLSILFFPKSISLYSLDIYLFLQYFLVYFFKLNCYFFLSCLFPFVQTYSSIFPLFYHFGMFS